MKEYLSPKMDVVRLTSTDIMFESAGQFDDANPTNVVDLNSLFE